MWCCWCPSGLSPADRTGNLSPAALEGTFYIDILSPSRLYERVLESGGRDQREPLNSAGRRMAVSLALERLEDKLGYYGAMSLRTGFVEKTAALITDLKRGGMTPETLAAVRRASLSRPGSPGKNWAIWR